VSFDTQVDTHLEDGVGDRLRKEIRNARRGEKWERTKGNEAGPGDGESSLTLRDGSPSPSELVSPVPSLLVPSSPTKEILGSGERTNNGETKQKLGKRRTSPRLQLSHIELPPSQRK
jgi:hypothetical protein